MEFVTGVDEPVYWGVAGAPSAVRSGVLGLGAIGQALRNVREV
jgi:hypothetical protein